MSPCEMNCLVPVSLPSESARVRRAAASLPEPGSVRANAAISWPWASGGTSRCACSGVP